jgi:hypothetical protein
MNKQLSQLKTKMTKEKDAAVKTEVKKALDDAAKKAAEAAKAVEKLPVQKIAADDDTGNEEE